MTSATTPQRPEQTDQRPAVAQRFQVQGQEGVVRPMGQLHQAHAQVERQHARLAQLGEEAALAFARFAMGRLGIGHPPAAQHDAEHDTQQRRRVDIQAQALEQRAETDHGADETDRAPQANPAVAGAALAQVGQGDDLELRQHGVPEERVQRHHQGQPGVAVADEDQREAQRRAYRAEAHDGQALAAAVAQPAPQVGRDATHQHGNRHQLADARAGEAQVMEIQGEERRRGAEQAEIEEIEAGQAPVGNRAGHDPPFTRPASLPATALTAAAGPACRRARRRSAHAGAAIGRAGRWPSSPRRSAWRGCRRTGRDGPW